MPGFIAAAHDDAAAEIKLGTIEKAKQGYHSGPGSFG